MGFVAVLLALCCALAPVQIARASKPPLGHFLARMRAASGPIWRTHLAATEDVPYDASLSAQRSDALGLRRVTRRCRGELCGGEYFDGYREYAIGINGAPLAATTQTDFAQRGLRTVTSLEFLAPTFISDGGHIEDAGTVRLHGQILRLLLVANSDATPMQVFVDPRTARITYVQDIFARTLREYLEYRDIGDGISLPMEVLRNGSVVQRYLRRWVPAGAFPTPHALAVTFSGPNVPITTDPDFSIPIFPCTLGNVAARCLLDSGNSGLSMSLDLAERLNAPTIGLLHVTGLGRYATAMVRGDPLRFGNVTLPSADYTVLDDISHDEYNVVLGSDVFAAMRIEIDFASHTVRVNPPPRTDGITIPLHFLNAIPVAVVQLGSLTTQLVVDTGDESPINLTNDFYSAHPTLFAATQERKVTGIGGRSVESMGRIERVTVGSTVLSDQAIGVTHGLGGLADGHLGAAFFAPFTVVLDYASNELRLIPRDEQHGTPTRSP